MKARNFALSALASSLAAVAPAQLPPGAEPPLAPGNRDGTPEPASPAGRRWQAARDALAGKQPAVALPHLLAALEFHPASPLLLLDAVRAAAGNADLAASFAHRYLAAAADPQGRIKLDAATRALLPPPVVEPGQRLAELRAQALAEVARMSGTLAADRRAAPTQALVQRLATDLWFALADDLPAQLRPAAAALQKAEQRWTPAFDLILPGLQRVLRAGTEAAAAGDVIRQERALRAAYELAGLARQAAFQDLQGPPPPRFAELASEAGAALADLRARAMARHDKVWTTVELSALTPEQRDELTLQHRRWDDPAVATTPNGRYRIETVCGFATLLAAATQLEQHHARLATHAGADPFLDRPGLVRIVPTSAGLESEGAPFWWAGGFQGGDTTTIRLAWGTATGMGRTLTHELTHRFDGVLHPFLPPWFGEGHASWTAAHYAAIADRDCVEDFLDVGTCAQTYAKGYAAAANLELLVTGKVKEYRDNYFAGYALYAYLRGYPPKAPPRFRTALQRFAANGRNGLKDPLAWFSACFADGKDGRPAGFPAFAADFGRFLRDCYERLDERTRNDGNAWVDRYGPRGDGEASSLLPDEPTWTWDRGRAEPCFGQGHAAAVGEVLLQAGDLPAAAAALLWSLRTDGVQLQPGRQLLQALAGLDRKDAAACLAVLLYRHFPTHADRPTAPSPLLPQLPRTKAFAQALATAAADLAAAGCGTAAGDLQRQHTALADLLGLPPATAQGLQPPPLRPQLLGGLGWVEESLCGYDDRRQAGQWCAGTDGDLHVGRDRPREGTGRYDRSSPQRDAFVRSAASYGPGAYVLRARVHFTTAFVSGDLLVGHWRRDRALRLHFAAGDAAFATGRREQDLGFEQVGLSLQGGFERDGQLPATAPAANVRFPVAATSIELELRIRGPSVLVKANGEPQFRYTTPDGAPIAGHIGFAVGTGSIRVEQPTVTVLPPGPGQPETAAVALDPQATPPCQLDDLLQLPTHGIPLDPCGTLVLWLCRRPPKDEPRHGLQRALPLLAGFLRDRREQPQRWVLALPHDLDAASRADVVAAVQEVTGTAPELLEHRLDAPFTGSPWLLFVDAHGVLRAAAEAGDPALFSQVQKWARRFRAR